ncbi:MAG TPA: cache domain-containing protein [Spirochaetia bacterium]|nr:cache domain-containing protein [Spirochaetia bacterium]
MIISIRVRLIASFLAVTVLVGGLSLLVGGQLIYRAVLREAQTRIDQDLGAAREIYDERERSLLQGLVLAAGEEGVRSDVRAGAEPALDARLQDVKAALGLDFIGVVAPDGRRLLTDAVPRSTPPAGAASPIASLALQRGAAVSGTLVLSREELLAESPALADRARIALIPTARAAPRDDAPETSGLALCAAVPLTERGIRLGALYGGVLLSRNQDIVDRIRDTVFREEAFGGRLIGTATIFYRDLRIATNVQTAAGDRAVGTRVSAEVRQRVLDQGERWSGRAFVVNDWYVTAYEPIVDIAGQRVGMLYVGVLESKYASVRISALLVFVVITMLGMAAAVALGALLSYRILRPVQELVEASRRVSEGDLGAKIWPSSRGEMGVLQRTFSEMLLALQERDQRLLADRERQLVQSEKQASIGRLAAGIAHEINNPLTGVLTFTHMLLARTDLDASAREDLGVIAKATERVRTIVKGLLDFSRQTAIEPKPTDVNDLVVQTMRLAANQALIKGVKFCFNPTEGLPPRTLDRNQMQSVLLNLLINSIDATEGGGHIDVSTAFRPAGEGKGPGGIEIRVSDTGCGIPAENLDRIFDPFFTTKEVGKGTGLGLSVSQGIVERHGGTIQVSSRPGEGATFVVSLPLDGGVPRPGDWPTAEARR